jgi:hypothetical protein
VIVAGVSSPIHADSAIPHGKSRMKVERTGVSEARRRARSRAIASAAIPSDRKVVVKQ